MRALSATLGDPALRYFWLYGPPGTVETISLRDLLRRDVGPVIQALASSSVAFIGASDPELARTIPTAFRPFSAAAAARI